MKEISFRKALAGMAVLFVIGFVAGWFAWYAVYPNLLHGGDSPSSTGAAGWSGTSTTSGNTTTTTGTNSSTGSTANW